MSEVEIKYPLTPKQKEIMAGFRRFTLWRAGRRAAKSAFAIYKIGKYALTHAKSLCWYVAQDSSLLDEEIIPKFLTIFESVIAEDKTRGRLKYVLLVNGSRVVFKSANSNNSLRGRGINFLVCEEAVFWNNGHSLYHETLRPQLSDFKGECLIISSPPSKKCPKGAEWFRRLEGIFQEQIKNGSLEYAVFHSTIHENPHISQSEIEAIKATTDPDTWRVEYLGEYNDRIGQVYWEFSPLKHKGLNQDNPLMRVRGMDFGIEDNTACAWISLFPDNKVYISGEYVANNLDVPSHARAIKAQTQVQPQYSVLDSACWARDATLTSVAKRFAQEGIACIPGTKDFDGSVSDMKQLFANGMIMINPACVNLIQAIADWQHGSHEPDILAAARYGIDALIRAGKLIPPVRTAKNEVMNVLQKREEMERRMGKLNSALAYKERFGNSGVAFKIIK